MSGINMETRLLPYLLLLPEDSQKRRIFIRTILASKLARSVLLKFSEEGKAIQRDLVRELPHSNKSILAYLKALGRYGLTETISTISKGKRVVSHELTESGWRLARLFSEQLPSDFGELTASLLEDYVTHLASLYRERGIEKSDLFDIFRRVTTAAIFDGSIEYEKPDFLLFGASSYFTQVDCDEVPQVGDIARCGPLKRIPSGPTVELALALSRGGFHVALVSSVGNDQEGLQVISELIQNNVDVKHIAIEEGKHTNETIVLDERKGSRTFVSIDKTMSLSITSPSQVPWEKLEASKAVYIGEVFVEVAASVAANAKTQNIPVVHRCSVPFLQMGLPRLKPVLSQVDVILLSNRGWRYLRKSLNSGVVAKFREITNAALIVRQSKRSYKLYQVHKKAIRAEGLHFNDDITIPFTYGLLEALAEKKDVVTAFEAGIEAEGK